MIKGKGRLVIAPLLLSLLVLAGCSATNNTTTSSVIPQATTQDAVVNTAPAPVEPQIEVETTTETADIPCSKTSVDDSTLDKGKTVVKTACKNGVKTTTYETTYTDGVAGEKKEVKTETTTQPVTEVTAIGTKVEAPAPAAPSDPYADATAQCKDGSYSTVLMPVGRAPIMVEWLIG